VAAADAEYRKNMLLQRGVDSIASMAGDADSLIPLYNQSSDSEQDKNQVLNERSMPSIFDLKSDPMGYFNID